MTADRTLTQMMDLSEEVCLITGATGHIGRVTGEALAELGCSLVLLDLDQAACDQLAKDLSGKFSGTMTGLALDLTDEEAVKTLPEIIATQCGRLDVLINSAAMVASNDLAGWAVPFADQGKDAWNKAMDVNLTAPFLLSQALAPLLSAGGAGRIINIGSIYGSVGPDMSLYEGTAMGNPAAYAASKGGLLQLTRWLSTVLAPKVRVNAITLGGVYRGQPDNFVDRYNKRTPLGRMAKEEDIKGAIAYLASGLSAYVTGQDLAVDGGWTAW